MVHIRFIFFQTFPNSGNAIRIAPKSPLKYLKGRFCRKKRKRNYGRNTVLEAVLDLKISIWINSKLNSLQLISYQCIPNYGEEFILIKVRFLVKKERLYFFEKHFKIETASQSLLLSLFHTCLLVQYI